MGMRNTWGQQEGSLFISGKILDTSGVPSVASTSNLAHAADVTVTDNGAGDYVIVVANFKGPRGLAIPVLTAGTDSLFASATSVSYSGTTLSVVVKMNDDASTLTDSSFYFHIHAF